MNNKNYYWNGSTQTPSVVTADGANFYVRGVPQLFNSSIGLLYSNFSPLSTSVSKFNLNTGFVWSYVP